MVWGLIHGKFLNDLPRCQRLVNINKDGKSILSLEKFKGYIKMYEFQTVPHYGFYSRG